MKNKKMQNALNLIGSVDTTIGELVAVLSEIAKQTTKNEEEQYMLVSQALSKILSQNGKDISEKI